MYNEPQARLRLDPNRYSLFHCPIKRGRWSRQQLQFTLALGGQSHRSPIVRLWRNPSLLQITNIIISVAVFRRRTTLTIVFTNVVCRHYSPIALYTSPFIKLLNYTERPTRDNNWPTISWSDLQLLCWTSGLQRRGSWISARVGHSGVVAASVAQDAARVVILYTRRR